MYRNLPRINITSYIRDMLRTAKTVKEFRMLPTRCLRHLKTVVVFIGPMYKWTDI